MSKTAFGVLYVLVMIVTIVGLDVLYFKELPWARLALNVGIVLIFGAFYLRLFPVS